MGQDPSGGRALEPAERTALTDPFARLVLQRGAFPLTLAELLGTLSQLDGTPDALPRQHVFALAEGGQIRWTPDTAHLPRGIRYVVARGRADEGGADLLISSRPPQDDPQAFLQVAARDGDGGAIQYYERVGRSWFWEGSSWHALQAPTRGQGPFDSHVNGTPVMKELKAPWLHWHSSVQVIPLESFPPGHPVRTDPIFAAVEGAHILETTIVRPAVRRWTRYRLDRVLGDPRGVADPAALLRHVLTATTVNIVSSGERSQGPEKELRLPFSLFVDADALFDLLELDVRTSPPIAVRRLHYEAAVGALGISLRDGNSGFAQPGDAFFAWPAPERAFEDQVVVAELVRRGVLSPEFVLALLMVDIANPIDSPPRAALMAHVPPGPLPAAEIEPRMRAALAAGVGSAPEAEAAARLLALGETALRAEAVAVVNGLLDALRERAHTPSGVIELMRLADARRRAFRKRKLAEFDLTLPFAAAGTAGALELRGDGAVVTRGPPPAPAGLAAGRARGGQMTLQIFDPPGLVEDLTGPQRDAWHRFISDAMDSAQRGDTSDPYDHPRPQFFNSAQTAIPNGAATEDVKWTAFPRILQVTSGSDRERWRRADAARDLQDEYCEWSATRDPASGKLRRITFTCEGPEYWRFLAAANPARTLELYREHIDSGVRMEDLYTADGRYTPRNRWNNSTSEGAMHLIQRNNTLTAEIEIAGAATIVRRRPDGDLMTDTQELILCGRYGAPERHSDPFIGARVNFHARGGALITIANPVGIYFAGLDTQGWETQDGANPASFWRYTRGTADRPVRAVLEVPSDRPYLVGDILIDGRPIAFAAQVADKMQMTIRAVAAEAGQHPVQPVQGCVGKAAGAPGGGAPAAGPVSVEAALAPRARPGRV